MPGSSKDAGKKRKAAPESAAAEEPSKRSKSSPTKSGKKLRDQVTKPVATPKSSKPEKSGKEGKSSKKASGKGKAKEVDSDSEDENSDLEKAYHDAHARTGEEVEDDEHADADDLDTSLVHESLKKSGKKASRSGPKVKFVPADETPELRDQRTIFVGNLSVDVASKRVSS